MFYIIPPSHPFAPPAPSPRSAEVNARDRWGATPLADALRGDHSSAVEMLKQLGGVLWDDAADAEGGKGGGEAAGTPGARSVSRGHNAACAPAAVDVCAACHKARHRAESALQCVTFD